MCGRGVTDSIYIFKLVNIVKVRYAKIAKYIYQDQQFVDINKDQKCISFFWNLRGFTKNVFTLNLITILVLLDYNGSMNFFM